MSVEDRVSVLLSPGRTKTSLQVNPADVPALEIKLGALVVLLTVTLLFGFAPLCILRGVGRCSVDSGKKPGTMWTTESAVGVGLSPVLLVVADLRRRLLSLISCFAGGVFLATCLLDLLPDYLQGISEAFSSAGITVRPQGPVLLGNTQQPIWFHCFIAANRSKEKLV